MPKICNPMFIFIAVLGFLAVGTSAQACTNDSDCKNGGTCYVSTSESRTETSFCKCADRMLGNRCEIFCPLSCDNGGKCMLKHDGTGQFECGCPTGWGGALCNVATPEECPDGSKCFNGGYCTEKPVTPGSYECDCRGEWTGEFCVTKLTAVEGGFGQLSEEEVIQRDVAKYIAVRTGIAIATGISLLAMLVVTYVGCRRSQQDGELDVWDDDKLEIRSGTFEHTEEPSYAEGERIMI